MLEDRLEFIRSEYESMERRYEAVMEDFDRKCQEQYNEKRDRSDFVEKMNPHKYDRDSDDGSNSDEERSNW
jgi:hypothetical protein